MSKFINRHEISKKVYIPDFDSLAESILWQLPNFVIWKDLNSTYLGCNKNFAKLAGFPI